MICACGEQRCGCKLALGLGCKLALALGLGCKLALLRLQACARARTTDAPASVNKAEEEGVARDLLLKASACERASIELSGLLAR